MKTILSFLNKLCEQLRDAQNRVHGLDLRLTQNSSKSRFTVRLDCSLTVEILQRPLLD